jgi:hypothetical protein
VFDRIARHFFAFLSSILSSPHFQVVIEALSIYERDDWRPMIKAHTPFVIDRYFPIALEFSTKHWNADVRTKAADVVAIMEKEWPPEVVRLRKAAGAKTNNHGSKSSSSSSNPKLQIWAQIISMGLPEPERKPMLAKCANACRFDLDPRKKRSHFMPHMQATDFKDIFLMQLPEVSRTASASLPPLHASTNLPMLKSRPSAGPTFPRPKFHMKPLV